MALPDRVLPLVLLVLLGDVRVVRVLTAVVVLLHVVEEELLVSVLTVAGYWQMSASCSHHPLVPKVLSLSQDVLITQQ